DRPTVTSEAFVGEADLACKAGRIEWAITWPADEEEYISTYCNTIPTPEGGTHESGLGSAITKGIKSYGELTNNEKIAQITGEDILDGGIVLLSLFMRNPQFQGQT